MAARIPFKYWGILVRFVAPSVGQPAALSVFRSLHVPDRQSFALWPLHGGGVNCPIVGPGQFKKARLSSPKQIGDNR